MPSASSHRAAPASRSCGQFIMGFRFRKTVRFGKLIRLNFSNSGTNLGLGPRGANINIGKRGIRQTIGIPGSGLSYQTFTKWTDQPKAADPSLPPPSPLQASSDARIIRWSIVGVNRPGFVGGQGTGDGLCTQRHRPIRLRARRTRGRLGHDGLRRLARRGERHRSDKAGRRPLTSGLSGLRHRPVAVFALTLPATSATNCR